MLLLVAILFVAWLVAAVVLFVIPHDDEPIHADAVVVLQGSDTRLPVGYRLVQEGYAPLLVVSRGSKTDLEARLCGDHPDVRVLCFQATSTREEARFVGHLAEHRNWQRLDVVTSHFHVFRARLIVRRCYHGELRMIGAPQRAWRLPKEIVKESAKLAYQLLIARGC